MDKTYITSDGVVCSGKWGDRLFSLQGICQESNTHRHNQDHWMIQDEGESQIERFEEDGHTRIGEVVIHRVGDPPVLIKANEYHRRKSLTEVCRYRCRFQMRDKDGKEITVDELYERGPEVLDEGVFT